MSRPRGFVVVTGSELVRGDRNDLNGPFVAAELLRLGIEPARIVIFSTKNDPAVSVYPDSAKVGVWPPGKLFPLGAAVDYWEGELG